MPRLELRRADELTPEEHAAVAHWEATVFPNQGYVITPMEWRILLWVGDRLVSHVGVVRRTVEVGGQPVHVAGIGWVGTLGEYRHSGLGSQTMRRAQEFLHDPLGVDFGLLVTSDQTRPFYERLGWQTVPGPIAFDQPSGKATWGGIGMALPVRRREWPGGSVDLRGLLW